MKEKGRWLFKEEFQLLRPSGEALFEQILGDRRICGGSGYMVTDGIL